VVGFHLLLQQVMAITLVASVTSRIVFLTVAGIEQLVRGRRSRANLEA
jgi:hypothetical protein